MNKQRALAFGSVLVFIAALVLSIIKSPTLLIIKRYHVYPERINQSVTYECQVYENGEINYLIYTHKPLIDTSNIKIPLLERFIRTKIDKEAVRCEYVCKERELKEIKELLENLDSDEELTVSRTEPWESYLEVIYKGKKRTYPTENDYGTTYQKLEFQVMVLCPLHLPEIYPFRTPESIMY